VPASFVVVGLDNGGTCDNATVLDNAGRFLIPGLLEVPSRVREGPDAALAALIASFDSALDDTGLPRSAVLGVGLDSPGPASAQGVISIKGSTNFGSGDWAGFDLRSALEERLGLPVVYNNDANAAALYAHQQFYGPDSPNRSSVSVIVGTGLGGGVVIGGRVVQGAAGMAGELGHVHIPLDGLLEADQPTPTCNCGLEGDAESFASLTDIEKNLLPYWLSRFPQHELAGMPRDKAARMVRALGEAGDPMAVAIFTQQAIAIGRLFTLAANFIDPDAYFLGGGVVEASPEFRDWFLHTVRRHTEMRFEAAHAAVFALVPDLDMAGARGAAMAAMAALETQSRR